MARPGGDLSLLLPHGVHPPHHCGDLHRGACRDRRSRRRSQPIPSRRHPFGGVDLGGGSGWRRGRVSLLARRALGPRADVPGRDPYPSIRLRGVSRRDVRASQGGARSSVRSAGRAGARGSRGQEPSTVPRESDLPGGLRVASPAGGDARFLRGPSLSVQTFPQQHGGASAPGRSGAVGRGRILDPPRPSKGRDPMAEGDGCGGDAHGDRRSAREHLGQRDPQLRESGSLGAAKSSGGLGCRPRLSPGGSIRPASGVRRLRRTEAEFESGVGRYLEGELEPDPGGVTRPRDPQDVRVLRRGSRAGCRAAYEHREPAGRSDQ